MRSLSILRYSFNFIIWKQLEIQKIFVPLYKYTMINSYQLWSRELLLSILLSPPKECFIHVWVWMAKNSLLATTRSKDQENPWQRVFSHFHQHSKMYWNVFEKVLSTSSDYLKRAFFIKHQLSLPSSNEDLLLFDIEPPTISEHVMSIDKKNSTASCKRVFKRNKQSNKVSSEKRTERMSPRMVLCPLLWTFSQRPFRQNYLFCKHQWKEQLKVARNSLSNTQSKGIVFAKRGQQHFFIKVKAWNNAFSIHLT